MPRVMVVDDDEDIVQLIKFLMEREQFEVIEAYNGLEAYHKLTEDGPNKAAPDVIILDIMMPRLDGWSVLALLAGDAGTRAVPVVVCSLVDDPELSHVLGAQGYLRKPVSESELLAELTAVLRRPRVDSHRSPAPPR